MLARLAAAVVIVLVLAGATVASAARLTFANGTVAAGSAPVGACDISVTATATKTGSAVSSVVINDIAPTCAGGSLVATLTQNGAPLATLAPVVVPAGGGSVTVAVPAPQPLSSAVTDVRVVVVGP